MEDLHQKIKSLMPYASPFLFVDEFLELSEKGVKGTYTFKEEEYFYQGHFPGNPVTPGVIMIETMAQIGLVGLGIFLTNAHETLTPLKFVFTSSEVEFLKPVFPGEQVWVAAEKVYFRLGKLKCKIVMTNKTGEALCRGTMAGMIVDESKMSTL